MRVISSKGNAHYRVFSSLFTAVLILMSFIATGQIQTFPANGTVQTYTVPSNVALIKITVKGAQGGNGGGAGASISGEFSVTPGEVFKVLPGSMGTMASNNNGGGGGGSFVWKNAGNTLLIAAGGGGGRSGNSNSSLGGPGSANATTTASINGSGNGAGGVNGNGGVGGTSITSNGTAGAGAGWFTNGGNGNLSAEYVGTGGMTPLNGGNGGSGFNFCNNIYVFGGFGGGGGGASCSGASGGGGGYNGGGGGNDWNNSTWGSGGGGGSYNGGTNQVNQQGTNTGNGSITIEVLTVAAGALHFDGQNDYVRIANPYTAFNNEITVEWTGTMATTSPMGSVMGQSVENVDGSTSMVWNMHPNGNGTFTFWVSDNGTWKSSGNVTIPTGSHRWVGVANASGIKLYMDGSLVASSTNGITTGILNVSNSVIHIGKDSRYSAGRFMNGSIDEVRIWNRALCQTELQTYSNCELGGAMTGLVEYYKFNEGFVNFNNAGTTTLPDLSGADRDGVLNNFGLTGTTSNWIAGLVTGTCAQYQPQPVSIAADGPTTTCGASVTMNATMADTYQWYLNGNPIQGATAPSYTATVSGNYSLEAVMPGACAAKSSVITVTIKQPATFTTQVVNESCPGKSDGEIKVLASGGNGTYAYSFNNMPLTASNTLSNLTAGNYPVEVFSDGCLSGIKIVAVATAYTAPAPVITASGSTSICNGSSVTLTASGANSAGTALQFNGNNYAFINRNISNDFTIEAWIKTSSPFNSGGTQFYQGAGLMYADVGGLSNDFGTSVLNGKFAFGTGGFSDQTIVSNTTVSDGQWHHVAAVRRNGVIEIYVDGVLEKSKNTGYTGALSSPTKITMGANTVDSRYYTGLLDEMRVWNVARTSSEIQSNLNTTVPVNTTGLAGYWRFNEGSGTTAVDISPAANSGTLVNNPGWVASTAPIQSTYTWSPSTGLDITLGAIVKASPSQTTTYTVTATNASGCSATASQTVTIIAGLDSDGDGIPDSCDADDDNDGITDFLECNTSNFFWSSAPAVNGNTATGTINGINYVYTSSSPVSTTGYVYGHGVFPSTYNIPNGTTIKNIASTTNTLTFATPIENPVLVFASIGNPGFAVPIEFSNPIDILFSQDVVKNSPTKLTGYEGYAVVRLNGIYSSISFNYLAAENWANFLFGADFQTCGDTDGDGTKDYLDTDSDGDGCSDAIEGSQNPDASQISNGRLTGGVNASGIPLVVNGGQGIGTSKTSNVDCHCQPGIDKTIPVITCPGAKTLASCETVLPDYTGGVATDNCTTTVTQSPVAGSPIGSGATITVTLTAKDAAGNMSAPCTFTVTRPNITPVATNDAVTVCAGSTVNIPVLGNDTHPQGSVLTINDYAVPSVGTLLKNADNTFTYTAPAGYSGPVTFTYSVKASDATIGFTENGHYYEWVAVNAITWTDARAQAETKYYNGLKGYLVTVTSQAELNFVASKLKGQGWMGASDLAYEGTWRWVTGPEGLENGGLGRHFSNQFKSAFGNCSASQAPGIGTNYSNWGPGEPNDCGATLNQYTATDVNRGGEHYAHFFGAGSWNDYPNNVGGNITGYVVEYGGLEGCIPQLTATATVTITVNGTPTATIAAAGGTTACPGSAVTLNATGNTNGGTLQQYQWVKNGQPVPGANASGYAATSTGSYSVMIFNTNGCNSISNAISVTITDVTAPVPNNASLTTVTAECATIVTAPTATDNCKGTITGTTTDPVEYKEQGTYTIKWTYNDGNGNVTTQFQTVIINDVTPPVISCVSNISVANDAGVCGAVVTYATPTATDNCIGVVPGTQTFSYEGTTVPFVVPAGVTSINVTAKGAQGKSLSNSKGGFGGVVNGKLAVTPGQTIYITVGGENGYNGGGLAGTGNTNLNGANGGGASDIRIGGTSLTNRVAVAAGGGGAGRSDCASNHGGAGGYPGGLGGESSGLADQTGLPGTMTAGGNSANGSCSGNCACSPGGGGGGGQDGGGAGGAYGTVFGGYTSQGGTNGACGQVGSGAGGGDGSGGNGGCFGFGGNGGNSGNGGGAGGGGGWYGGGAGGGNWASGGGGGSSYIGGLTNTATQNGSNAGNGTITLSWAGSAVSVVQTSGLASGSTFPIGTTTNTFVATDASGNTSTCSFTVTVADTEAPKLIGVPANTTVQCNAVPAPANVTATDNCAAGVVNFTETKTIGNCAGNYTLTRTWSVKDAAGNTTTASQTITVQDNQPPTITTPFTSLNRTVECSDQAGIAAALALEPTATDNCGAVSITLVSDVTTALCGGTYTRERRWQFNDECGNTSGIYLQVISVKDFTAPTFTRPADITIYKDGNCQMNSSPANTGDVTNENDNCSQNIQATFFDVVMNGNCQGAKIIKRTWQLKDNCGNAAANQVQMITVLDNTAPTFTRPADVTIYTNANCGYDASTSNVGDVTDEADNCSQNIEATYADVVTDGTCAGTKIITRTWSLSDNCGNAAADQVQTITVLDNTVPTFTRPADVTIYTDANCGYDASTTNVGDVTDESDNCSAGIQATYTDVVTNGTCAGTKIITRTWSLSDNCGNAAANQVQTITVLDNIAPTVTAVTASVFHCYDAHTNGSYAVPVITATDNCTPAVSYSYLVVDGNNNTVRSGNTNNASGSFPVGTNTIKWTIKDDCGNTTTAQTVVTINPLITGTMSNFTVLSQGVQANTLYLGYTPASSATISITTAGGTAPYTYSWSTSGSSSSFTVVAGNPAAIKVNAVAAGTYTYTVVVTDSKGCKATFTKTIVVVDIRCGNNNDKVQVCHVPPGNPGNPQTICIAPSAVAAHLVKGSYLGICNASVMVRSGAPKTAIAEMEASLLAYPNPNRGQFNLKLSDFKAGKISIVITDGRGKQVLVKESFVSFSIEDISLDLSKLAAGIYNVRVTGEKETKHTRVVIAR